MSEKDLRAHVKTELFAAALDILESLGINGDFESQNSALVGRPGFSWVSGPTRTKHPKLVVRDIQRTLPRQRLISPFRMKVDCKTDWSADLQDLLAFFAKHRSDRTTNERQSIDAVEQIYGYLTLNNLKYGVLSNWTRSWFLRRVEEGDRKILEYAGPIELPSSSGRPTMSILKAIVGMAMLSEKDWLCVSSTRFFGQTKTALKKQKKAIKRAGYYNVAPNHGTYPLLTLDYRLCDFQRISSRLSWCGSVVDAKLLRDSLNLPPLDVVCKIADVMRYPDACDVLAAEARMYASLQHLQGDVIPTMHGYYKIWGTLHLLALEPVGQAISEDRIITDELRHKMKSALSRIHASGYLHGDIARRNFCEKGDKVFIIDLERCRESTSKSELVKEEQLIDYQSV
jgi:hypothetical protein